MSESTLMRQLRELKERYEQGAELTNIQQSNEHTYDKNIFDLNYCLGLCNGMLVIINDEVTNPVNRTIKYGLEALKDKLNGVIDDNS